MALWWYHVLTHVHLMTAILLGHTVFRGRKRHVIKWNGLHYDIAFSAPKNCMSQHTGHHKVERAQRWYHQRAMETDMLPRSGRDSNTMVANSSRPPALWCLVVCPSACRPAKV